MADDLINFWDGSIKNKMAAAAIRKRNGHGGSGGHFFSLFLAIVFDGQSLRPRVLLSIDGYNFSLPTRGDIPPMVLSRRFPPHPPVVLSGRVPPPPWRKP